jgi:GIY-YIG catalytic domain
MPRTPIDYSKTSFYTLVCRDPRVQERYVGHTTNVVNRRRCHKSDCHNKKSTKYSTRVYQFIRDHGGWSNWQLLEHENISCKDKIEATLREQYWTVFFNATLNSDVPGRTSAEWYVDHREKILAVQAEHRAANPDKFRERSVRWHAANRETHNKKKADWKVANQDILKKKNNCRCGGCYTMAGKAQHFKSARHLAFIAKESVTNSTRTPLSQPTPLVGKSEEL